MKKTIKISQLEVGMFVESDDAASGRRSLKARLITGREQIQELKSAGLTQITIDTDKGKDLPKRQVVVRAPRKAKPKPPGRQVPYKEELKQARVARRVVSKAVKGAMEDVALGGSMDKSKLDAAGKLITKSVFRNVDAMVGLTRIKEQDPYTATHCVNVCVLVLAVALSEGISESDAEMLATAALLHDVGKTKVPLEVLNKPGRFEPHELAEMRKHTVYGEEILREMPGITDEVLFIATQHHEMFDGTGYPHSLTGDEISRFGQMTAVADVYDALTSARVYKPAMPPHFALGRIYGLRDTEFRSDVVDLFVKSLGLYPVGSLVILDTGEVGVVCEPNPGNTREPKVGVVITRYKKRRPTPLVVDLADPHATEKRKIVKVLDPAKYKVDVDKILKMTTG
jgi:putative nucleotidyltransferase with HDIG domain